jgi:crotonobetainyl-CoA:carnitine CoA-transferase CaiB-like acyl-CoA transferase
MLSPYRVLDLTTARGLLCGQILGDLGADVIQIEPPGGSPARQLKPFYHDQPHPDRSLYWWAYNRNKRGITLNLATSEGRELLRRLAATAHFLIESDTPGKLAQLGLGYEELAALNPALIYVSISPFGQDGPKASYADSDLVVLAAGGPLILTGDSDRAPVRISVPQSYLHASAEAAVAALVAHNRRQQTGQGQHVDVSAQQAVALATQANIIAVPLGDVEFQRMAGGVKIGPLSIRLVWPAKDGYVTVGLLFGSSLGPFTRRLIQWIYEEGACDATIRDIDWITFGGQLLKGQGVSEFERVAQAVGEFLRARTKADLLRAALDRSLLIAPVTTVDEVVRSEHLAARQYWRPLEHPELGQTFKYPGPFAQFSRTPIAYRRRPPTVGEHNREIYRDELGISAQQLTELKRKGVI